jgi:hypothetical protein
LILSSLLLFCCAALPADTTSKPAATATTVAADSPTIAHSEKAQPALPDMPVAKESSSLDVHETTSVSSDAITPGIEPFTPAPVKPAARGSYETARQRKIWYGLVVTGHSAALFDAYTTRRAISGGYGSESNPMLRPFAHSNAIYAATQVSPALMDYLGHRMMTSNRPWMRRLWWVPQVAGAGFSVSAGVHNYRVVP